MEAIFGLAEHLPLADDSYDVALMVTTICFVDRPRQSVNEMYRILKPGGYAVIGFVDKDSPVGRMYQENKNKSKFYREAHFFSAEEVKDLLVKAGFSNIEFVQTLFGKLDVVDSVQDFKEGYGDGSFVVVKGEKRVVSSGH
jgi:ubiquinone/menaquinone biosynthesis C-methylase UbiE